MPTYKTYLMAKTHHGFGKDTKTQKWFVSYYVSKDGGKPEICREFLPEGTTAEEAQAARDRRYMELALNGAVPWKPVIRNMRPRAAKKKEYPDDYGITPYELTVTKYKVVVGKHYVGKFENLTEAKRARDKYLRTRMSMKQCAICEKLPDWDPLGRKLTHKCKDCEYIVRAPLLRKEEHVGFWNDYMAAGHFPVKGRIGSRIIAKTIAEKKKK